VSPEPACVGLELESRPESVAIVRAAIAGLVAFAGCGEHVSTDVRTAVSEACNNVVIHAYHGQAGPLRMCARSAPGRIDVCVGDEGTGIHQHSRDPLAGGHEHLGLGLGLISALADELQVRTPARGGTEVTMRFHTGVEQRERGASPDCSWPARPDQLSGEDVVMWWAPAALSRHLVGSVARATAAALGFTIAGASDLHAIGEQIAAATEETASERLVAGVSVSGPRMTLTVGPMDETRLRARGEPLAALLDGISKGPCGAGELVRLSLPDRGREPVGN
jgi:serine/threonine-protein kinase RsbW